MLTIVILNDYYAFKSTFLKVLNKHALFMKKILRANHVSCTTIQSLKPNTLKTKLRKVLQKQRNFYSKLYKKN